MISFQYLHRSRLLVGALAPLMASFMAGCGQDSGSHQQTETATPLEPATVKVEVIQEVGQAGGEDIVGSVESERTAVIEAKVSGTVADVKVRPGERVAAGDVLVLLDAPEVTARRDQALAQYERAEQEFTKYQQLIASKAISQLDFERVESEFRRATAALEEAETMVNYTMIGAPFDGVVARRMADPGSQAAPGRGLLMLEDDTRLQFAAEVPEGLVNSIMLGQSLHVVLDVLGKPISGEVVEISPSADRASRTFLIKIRLPQVQGLRSGQFGRVRVPLTETGVLTVPSDAIVRRGQLEMLFMERDGRASMRLVRSGRIFGDRIEIVSGLESGEHVVVEGASKLRDGQSLNLQP